jgi:zinc protease
VQILFPKDHPYYGNVIGSHEDIQAVKLEDVHSFFRQYYAPNNASPRDRRRLRSGEDEGARDEVLQHVQARSRGAGPHGHHPKITTERRQTVQVRAQLPRVTMAWITPPIYKPGDADADVSAQVLGGGRSSRLYKKLVYEKQIAQNVIAQQYSLMLGSMFQIEATARPGHTAEELEKAIDEELAAFRASPPSAAELERARNTIETNIIGGLERLGGFGGIADRLNSYNHFLKEPGYLTQDIQRYRAVTPASVLAFAKANLTPNARGVIYAVPGTPAAPSGPPTPPAPAASTAKGPSINVDEPWRNTQPKPGPATRSSWRRRRPPRCRTASR